MTISKFVIYGIPRVGSNYFISLLNNHPEVLCHYEIFHKDEIYTGFYDKKISNKNFKDVICRNNNPEELLNKIFSTTYNFTVIGYNIFPYQNDAILIDSIQDISQRKIILKRKDVVRNYISWKIALETDIWTSREAKGIKINKQVKFDQEEFERRLNANNIFYNFIENHVSLTNQSYLLIYYEDLVDNFNDTIAKVFDFIGASTIKTSSETELKKQNVEKLSDLIINYGDYENFVSAYGISGY